MKLWRALDVATTSNPRLRGLDFHQLAARAEAQHAQVEKWRLQVAHTVFVTKASGNSSHTPEILAHTMHLHPSSISRAPDENARHEETTRFIADLKKFARVLQ